MRNTIRIVTVLVGAWLSFSSPVPAAFLTSPIWRSQLFTSSGTFTVPPNVTLIYLNASAGGGSGGCVSINSTYAGGGGASAATLANFGPVAVTPGSVLSVNIGNAGPQCSPGNNNGNDGGVTTVTGSVGPIPVLPAGLGGASGNSTASPAGGKGAVDPYPGAGILSTASTVNTWVNLTGFISGAHGQPGIANSTGPTGTSGYRSPFYQTIGNGGTGDGISQAGGTGGTSSWWGLGLPGANFNTSGSPTPTCTGYGAGGGGAGGSTSGAKQGSAGCPGFVLFWWFG